MKGQRITRRTIVTIIGLAVLVLGVGPVPQAAQADKATDHANSFCESYVGSTKDANYKPCVDLFVAEANAKAQGNSTTVTALRKDCSSSSDPNFCGDILDGADFHYTKSPTPGKGGTHSAAGCPSSGCISADQVGIPKVGVGSGLKSVVDILSFIAGVLSAIFLIIGGIRYSTSEGNPQNISSARLTITYAIIGIVISVVAPLIVGFVIARGPQ